MKVKLVAKLFYITKKQAVMLKSIKDVSAKSESSLIREAIDLLLKPTNS